MHQESLGQDCVPAKWLRASPSSPPRFSFSLWWCFQVRGLTPTWLLRPRLGRFLLLLLLLLLGAPLLLVELFALFPLLPPTLEGRLATSWFARALGARASVLRLIQGAGSQSYPGRDPGITGGRRCGAGRVISRRQLTCSAAGHPTDAGPSTFETAGTAMARLSYSGVDPSYSRRPPRGVTTRESLARGSCCRLDLYLPILGYPWERSEYIVGL